MDSFHPALAIEVELQPNLKSAKSTYRAFKNADYTNLNAFFTNTDWSNLYSTNNVDEKISILYNIVELGISHYVPVYSRKTSDFPCWFSNDLKFKTIQKKSAHSTYKKRPTRENYFKFSNLRRVCKNLSNLCYKNYVSNMELKVLSDPHEFWKFVKNKKRNNCDIPSSVYWNNKSANTGVETCDLFASFFESVYSSNMQRDNTASVCNPNAMFNALSEFEVSQDLVFKLLTNLNPRKGAGPDGLPNIFLANCAIGLCEPLTDIFSTSLESGTFPSVWKLSFVSPIHKDGPRSDAANYRPICIQSALAKLFEKLIVPQLTWHFTDIISNRQHGFVGGRSTASNLFTYTNYLIDALNDNAKVHSIYTDFSKAFDRVNHEILVMKLSSYGIQGRALSWIQSYLIDRKLQVRIDGHLSTKYDVKSGVPQGSHLGPILFNIFINDIGNNLHSDYLLYADDLKIYRRINRYEDMNLLQQDINTLADWCTKNKLDLNIKKCAVVSYSRSHTREAAKYTLNDDDIHETEDIKDLGIIVDSKLSFSKHIDKITLQANKVLGFITRTSKDFTNPHTLISLFNTLVRPILEYGSVIWSPYTDYQIKRIESVQRKFCRTLAHRYKPQGCTSTDDIYIHYGIEELQRRRQVTDLVFFYKVLNGLIDAPDAAACFEFAPANLHLRRRRLIKTVKSSKNYVIGGPHNRIANLVNTLNNDVEFYGGSIGAFVAAVKRHLT